MHREHTAPTPHPHTQTHILNNDTDRLVLTALNLLINYTCLVKTPFCYICLNYFQVQTAAQLKFVSDDDLQQLGMSKPEIRRLKKYFQKHFPQNYISKLKKVSAKRVIKTRTSFVPKLHKN